MLPQYQAELISKKNKRELASISKQLAEQTTLKPSGNVDDTAMINKAIANSKKVNLTSGIYHINAVTTIKMLSDRELNFYPGAVFKVIANDSTLYYVINISQCHNVIINNPKIIGDRAGHHGNTGEWGHGINIINSTNIRVDSPDISECWGDGIYIGIDYFTAGLPQTENVIINNPVINHCRRNGISLCSGKNITINNPVIADINGTAPQSGIDIEPEGTGLLPIMGNIKIVNPITKNCLDGGINWCPGGILNRNLSISILIDNHEDYGSKYGVMVYGKEGSCGGEVIFRDPKWKMNTNNGFAAVEYDLKSPQIKLIRPLVENCNQENGSGEKYNSAFTLFRESVSSNTYLMGGLMIIQPKIQIAGGLTKKPSYSFYFQDEKQGASGEFIQNISIIDPSAICYNSEAIGLYGTSAFISDANNVITNNVYYQLDVSNYNYYKKWISSGSHGVTLNALCRKGYTVTFETTVSSGLKITPDAKSKIIPLSTTKGQAIKSVQTGARITLQKTDANTWQIVDMIGKWTTI